MKNKLFILTLALLAGSVKADEQKHTWNLSYEEKKQLAWAIKILAYTGALRVDENKCMSFDPDLIDELRKSGFLKKGDSKLMTFCVGSRPDKPIGDPKSEK